MISLSDNNANIVAGILSLKYPRSRPVRLLCLLLILGFGGCVSYMFYQTIIAAQVRYLLLLFLAAVIVLTAANVQAKRYLLRQQAVSTDGMKLSAEIWAGCALLAFSGPFLNLGTSLDHGFSSDRLGRLEQISKQSSALLECSSPPAKATCQGIRDDLKKLEGYLAEKSEQAISETINETKARLRRLQSLRADIPYRSKLDELIVELDELDRSDGLLVKILQPLPVVSLLFASFAVSSKIALACPSGSKAAGGPADTAQSGKSLAETDQPASPFSAPVGQPQAAAPGWSAPVSIAAMALAAAVVIAALESPRSPKRQAD